MTNNDPEPGTALSEEQRAVAFANATAPAGRYGRPRKARAPIPSKFVLLVTAVFVVLGLGGVLVEHYFGGIGTTSTTTTVTLAPISVAPSSPQLSAATRAFIGLREIGTAQASNFTLHDQFDRMWSLARHRGKVVVLTFFNRDCNDICPVEGAVIRRAQLRLGAASSKVVFVIVNSDPQHLGFESRPPSLAATGLIGLRSVFFLTGSLNELNDVWVDYGLRVNVGSLASQVTHNNVMYFIAPDGRLRSLALPFANAGHTGRFQLSGAEVGRFAQGVATVAVSLAK
jgi:cytochrome oxidase Cu insertion factor (SCO1/SenC/PrrC family)